MSEPRPSKSAEALQAALATFGKCEPQTAAYLLFLGAARNLIEKYGLKRASELFYYAADRTAIGDEI